MSFASFLYLQKQRTPRLPAGYANELKKMTSRMPSVNENGMKQSSALMNHFWFTKESEREEQPKNTNVPHQFTFFHSFQKPFIFKNKTQGRTYKTNVNIFSCIFFSLHLFLVLVEKKTQMFVLLTDSFEE